MSVPCSAALSVSTEPSIYSPQPVYHPNVRSPSLRSQDYVPSSLAPPTPVFTRGSSGNTSSASTQPPVTPTDEAYREPLGLSRNDTVYRYYGPESDYGRDFAPTRDKGRTRPQSVAQDVETPTRAYSSPRRTAPPGPRSIVAPLMQRSAKELIDQCEQRDATTVTPPLVIRRNAQLPPIPLSAPRQTTSPPRAPPSHCIPNGSSHFSTFARSRGKLRNSFTNLVQILGERTKAKDNESLDPPSPSKRNSLSPSASRAFSAFKLKLGKRISQAAASPAGSPAKSDVHEAAPDINEPLEVEAQKTCLLLYQSPARQNQPNTSVPWMPYTVSLYPTSLALQVPNLQLSHPSSSKFQISLLDVYDVRSVESKDLPPGFGVPPADFSFGTGDGNELFVFEVESLSGRVERFAAGDFWTRKEWVSALIDTMMQHELKDTRSKRSIYIPNAEPALAPSSGSASGRTVSKVAPELPNPWDQSRSTATTSFDSARPVPLDSTPTRTPSVASTRIPSTPRSVTASPSISRLGERSIVRNQLAMFERQASPSPLRTPTGTRSGSVGPIHWEALAEVREGRSRSRTDSRAASIRGTISETGDHRPVSLRAKSPAESADSVFRLGSPLSISSAEGVGVTLLSRLAGPAARKDSPPIQVLGNVSPAKVSNQMEPEAGSLSVVSERIASLTAALRESDVAHSTKASGLGQLVASTQDHILHAMEQNTRTSSREHAIMTEHLERLHKSVESKGPDTETLAIKQAVERLVDSNPVVGTLGELKVAMDTLHTKLDDTSGREDILAKLESLGSRPLDTAVVEELIGQIKAHISSLEPSGSGTEILAKLDAMAGAIADIGPRDGLEQIRNEIKELVVTRDSGAAVDTSSVDLSDVLAKLDGISTMCQSFIETKGGPSGDDTEEESLKQEANEKLMSLLAALREDAEHRTTQAEQTSELVRYSNELNAWLEKFVLNASTQMDNVGAGLGALRRDLGLDPSVQNGDPPQQPGVLQQFRMALEEQTQIVAGITTTLNSLVASINEDRARNDEANQQRANEAVLKMIELQRQEQEQLLRKLATDLSSDIRGERLRFVEAMSHATSMNVQAHVEEFKKQLTREVLALTDEVGRLRDERKTIQHQIAQLFMIKSEHEMEAGMTGAPSVPAASTRPGAK